MEQTRFIDLNLQLGKQYLYCHHGDCEHVLVFESVRSYIPSIDNYPSFPVLIYQSKNRRKKCFACQHLPGRIVTTKDKYLSQNPYLFCTDCYKSFHEDSNGQLIYTNFEKHPYFS